MSLVYEDIDPEALKTPVRRKANGKNPKARRNFAVPEAALMPSTDADVLNNMLVRELVSPSGEIEEPSPTIGLYSTLMRTISKGEEIGQMRDTIRRITEHQPEKADVMLAVLNLIDQERTDDFVTMRANAEKIIKRASQRGDITTREALVVWSMANKVIAENRAQLVKHVKPVENTVIDKVDFHGQQQERTLAKRWEGTSPQGREIMRKKLYELKQKVKVTVEQERTVTETEEDVDPPLDV